MSVTVITYIKKYVIRLLVGLHLLEIGKMDCSVVLHRLVVVGQLTFLSFCIYFELHSIWYWRNPKVTENYWDLFSIVVLISFYPKILLTKTEYKPIKRTRPCLVSWQMWVSTAISGLGSRESYDEFYVYWYLPMLLGNPLSEMSLVGLLARIYLKQAINELNWNIINVKLYVFKRNGTDTAVSLLSGCRFEDHRRAIGKFPTLTKATLDVRKPRWCCLLMTFRLKQWSDVANIYLQDDNVILNIEFTV